jgi:hypothetical protein
MTHMYKLANVCMRENVNIADVVEHILATCDNTSHTRLVGVQ